ncbi:hypothetical protein AAFF_G00037040 [Aldrovandia affinis]|uniref:Uncharacterized protein n=1 Tax=Aldrovandia affinis TaxID=143900 RepID=A0AAD7T642_9TELE|nr:hypothetical protein AAFF_G00037040 [Aldrovandia affinis]
MRCRWGGKTIRLQVQSSGRAGASGTGTRSAAQGWRVWASMDGGPSAQPGVPAAESTLSSSLETGHHVPRACESLSSSVSLALPPRGVFSVRPRSNLGQT